MHFCVLDRQTLTFRGPSRQFPEPEVLVEGDGLSIVGVDLQQQLSLQLQGMSDQGAPDPLAQKARCDKQNDIYGDSYANRKSAHRTQEDTATNGSPETSVHEPPSGSGQKNHPRLMPSRATLETGVLKSFASMNGKRSSARNILPWFRFFVVQVRFRSSALVAAFGCQSSTEAIWLQYLEKSPPKNSSMPRQCAVG